MSKADSLRIPDYLEHIVEAIERIHRYVDDMSEAAFMDDNKTRDAVIRNYEIIGEAARMPHGYVHESIQLCLPPPARMGLSFRVGMLLRIRRRTLELAVAWLYKHDRSLSCPIRTT
jgi:hypothetical protein